MNAQDLKNSILQLAVQGKLVEQRAEEGTAEELYRKIQEEKKKLINEGKVKKEKPLAEITEDEFPFEIPQGWKWIRHNEIFEIVGGSQPPKSYFESVNKENYVRLYQIRDYGDKPVPVYVPRNKVTKFTQKGDILLARYGASVGKVFWAEEGAYNVAMARVVKLFTGDNFIYDKYLYFYYLSSIYQNLVKQNSRSAQAGFNKDDLDTLLFPLPPLEEQHRIVAKIEELLPYIEQYDKAYTQLEDFNKRFPEDMKKSILQYAMQGKLVEQRPEEGTADELYEKIVAEKAQLIKEGKIKKEKPLPEIDEDEVPFEIPSSWKWVRLGMIVAFQGGYAFKSTSYVEQSTNQVIRLGNIRTNMLLTDSKQVFVSDNIAEQAKDYKILVNDILVSMTGTRRKKDYFYTVLVTENDLKDVDLYLNQRVGCFRSVNNIYHKYLVYVLQTDSIKDIIFTKETGTANQGNLGSEDMKMYVYVPLPPLEEQKRIVAKIEELMPLCDTIKR